MCIIVAQPKSSQKDIPYEILYACHTRNPDGMGLVFVENGKLKIQKQMHNFGSFYKKYLHARKANSHVIAHFRIATTGEKRLSNVHPFYINPKIAGAHNGAFFGYGNDNISDTREFFKEVIKPLPNEWWKNASIRFLLENSVKTNKIAFLTVKNELIIINPTAGTWDKDLKTWFSHTGYRPIYKSGMYNSERSPTGWNEYRSSKITETEKKNNIIETKDLDTCRNYITYSAKEAAEKFGEREVSLGYTPDFINIVCWNCMKEVENYIEVDLGPRLIPCDQCDETICTSDTDLISSFYTLKYNT